MTDLQRTITVSTSLLERWAVLAETAANYGVLSHYEDGKPTPNSQLFEQVRQECQALLNSVD